MIPILKIIRQKIFNVYNKDEIDIAIKLGYHMGVEYGRNNSENSDPKKETEHCNSIIKLIYKFLRL